jgi:hypothetical protein
MSLYKEGLYTPEHEAVLVGFLKQADYQQKQGVWYDVIFKKIKPLFGLYFAEIERLSRVHELNIYFLASFWKIE